METVFISESTFVCFTFYYFLPTALSVFSRMVKKDACSLTRRQLGKSAYTCHSHIPYTDHTYTMHNAYPPYIPYMHICYTHIPHLYIPYTHIRHTLHICHTFNIHATHSIQAHKCHLYTYHTHKHHTRAHQTNSHTVDRVDFSLKLIVK